MPGTASNTGTIAYEHGRLRISGHDAESIAARFGTPAYVYSADLIRENARRVRDAFAPLGAELCYAVKACNNLHILRLIASLGAGMDVVSGGELERAWLAGVAMPDICFAGVGKSEPEIRAALDGQYSPLRDRPDLLAGRDPADRGPVGHINIESEQELERVARIAGDLGVRARCCVRLNPDVDARTHEYTTTGREINKFGIDTARVPALFDQWRGHDALELCGLHVHIGSPVRETEPYVSTAEVILRLIDRLEHTGHRVETLNLGGGWAVDYETGESPPIEAYADALAPPLAPRVRDGLRILIEPGRSIVANAGVLLTRVEYVKQGAARKFAVCDAGLHTIVRPALYRAFHFIWPARVAPEHVPSAFTPAPELPGLEVCDIVGPICETGDFLARERSLPPVAQGDLLCLFGAGAYGMSMSSNYNDHGRPAEVLVDTDGATLIARRRTLADELAPEIETHDGDPV